MFLKINCIVICYVLTIVTSDLVIDNRCDFTDHACLNEMYHTVLLQTAEGIPSLNIPQLDPMRLCNVVTSLPNSFKLTIVEGTVTGLKNCIFDDVEIHHEENFRITYNLTCSIELNANVKIEIPKSLMEELGGKAIDGELYTLKKKARLNLEKYHLFIDLPFEFKQKDCDIHIQVYTLDIYHNIPDFALIKFTVEDFDEDSKVKGDTISNYIQENAIDLNLMLPVTKKIGEFFQAVEEGLVAKMAANSFFKDDLSRHLKP